MNNCIKCGKPLSSDEIGLHKKLINKLATEYMCINCCGEYFEVSAELLEEKIKQFKKAGCQLFEY